MTGTSKEKPKPVVVTTACVTCGQVLRLHATSAKALPLHWETLAECPKCWAK